MNGLTLVKSAAVFMLLCVLASGCAVRDDEPRMRASVDRRAIFIGDLIDFRIDVDAPAGMEIDLPKFRGDMAGEFEIKDSSSSTRKIFGGATRHSRRFAITAYQPRAYKTPPVSVKFKPAGSDAWKAKGLNQIDIKVDSILPEKLPVLDVKDIKPPIDPRTVNYRMILDIFSGCFILGVIAWALWRFITRKPKKTPYETVMLELEEAKTAFAAEGDAKQYYISVSDAVRRYVESVFMLHAPEMTTQEFLDSLRDNDKLPVEYKGLMKDFLEACDLVKFARYVPATAETENVLATAKNFADGTRSTGEEKKSGRKR